MIEQCRECLTEKSDTECVILKKDWPYEVDICAECRPTYLAGHVDGLQVMVSGLFLKFEDLTFEAQSEILGSGMLAHEFSELISACIKDIADDDGIDDIADDDGIDDDDDGDCDPFMDLTIGFTPAKEDGTPESWGFQTGDNSYTGGAYSHPHWAVTTLYRDCDPNEVAAEMISQINELTCY
jgi:hypothetical protein